MASSYKYLGTNDRVVSTTNLTEQIDTSLSTSVSIVGTTEVKNGLFGKVFDSDSVNILDISAGRSSAITSGSYESLTKQNIVYNQMAKVLLGHDVFGSINNISMDSNATLTDNILHNAIFLNFNRNQFKDKIKKGTFKLTFKNMFNTASSIVYLSDTSGSSISAPVVRECQTGEYGILFVSGAGDTTVNTISRTVTTNHTGGLIFYEAGVAVISPYIFSQYNSSNPEPSSSTSNFNFNARGLLNGLTSSFSGGVSVGNIFVSGNMQNVVEGVRSCLSGVSYQATTELNSTVYFCRAFNNEFNYSSNPTYLSSSQVIVKEGDPMNQSVSYITTVGLYDDNNQLLAVAKLSEPVKKTPDTELIARVRLDF